MINRIAPLIRTAGLAFILCLSFTSAALAQTASDESQAPQKTDEAPALNTVYLELLGPGLLYSINYERRLADFNLRIGAGGASWSGSGYVRIPLGFNYIGIGSEDKHLELGATSNITIVGGGGASAAGVTFSAIVGYRYQPKAGGFNFRAGISPIIGALAQGSGGVGIIPWPYISFGASF